MTYIGVPVAMVCRMLQRGRFPLGSRSQPNVRRVSSFLARHTVDTSLTPCMPCQSTELQAYYKECLEQHNRQHRANGKSNGHIDTKSKDPRGRRETDAGAHTSINGNGHIASPRSVPQIPRKRRAEDQAPEGSPTSHKRSKEDVKNEDRDALKLSS